MFIADSSEIEYGQEGFIPTGVPMIILASTDLGTNWSSIWSITGNQGDEWKLGNVDLNSYLTYDKVMFRFGVTTGASSTSDVCLDDAAVQACAPPDNLDTASVTGTSAQLSWTENGNATTWDIFILPAGIILSNNPTHSGVPNPFIISTLLPGTCYDFYVRAHCTGGLYSTWTGPFNFCTDCPVAFTDYPYYQNFNRLDLPPRCWSR